MSAQAELIARKKAEIEAKLKNTSASTSTSSTSPMPSTSHPQQMKTKRMNIRNRWGIKSKPTASSTPNETKVATNSFSNDGSFLEQFREMKKPDPVKSEAQIKTEPQKLIEQEGKPSEDWYQAALNRARGIAKSLQNPPASSSQVKEEPNVAVKSEYGSSCGGPSKSEVKTEIGKKKENLALRYELLDLGRLIETTKLLIKVLSFHFSFQQWRC